MSKISCDDHVQDECKSVYWTDLLGRTDARLLHKVAKDHHQGSFYRLDPVDCRKFMHSLEDVKVHMCRELITQRAGDLFYLDRQLVCDKDKRRSPDFFYSDNFIKLEEISTVLEKSFSVQNEDGLRPYPSGGRIYPIETFIVIYNAEGIRPGIYHYLPWSHAFENRIDSCDELYLATLGQNQPWGSPAFGIIYVMDLARAIFKYRHRGYRLAMMEAGAMFQQASKVALELGLCDRVITSFSDHFLVKNMNLNPALFLPLATQIFGSNHE